MSTQFLVRFCHGTPETITIPADGLYDLLCGPREVFDVNTLHHNDNTPIAITVPLTPEQPGDVDV